MTAEFVLDLDAGMLEYFRDMVNVLVEGCGTSRPEVDAHADVSRLPIQPIPLKDSPFWTLRE
ncbi:hypothetical protein ACH4NO_08510 [Streptomyces olivaceus]|jgi:hypothetical protein|uniref:hypothetical protein n=1 Tax=Streptomyces olivaceus TaxID=47716 RepID=UPI0004C7204A|nr:hypothetical protein [Streptomyces olivaceus]MBZ6107267.1 hypothetical protein [Streptomyces olivaceus]